MLNQPGALLCDWTRGFAPCTKQKMVVVARWLLGTTSGSSAPKLCRHKVALSPVA